MLSHKLTRIACFVLCSVFLAFQAHASKRVALIIGNSNYETLSNLKNPKNDAEAIANAFNNLGFEVSLHLDLDMTALRRAMGKFARESRDSEMAVVYFAGHGVEVERNNYLLPTDVNLSHADDLPFQAINLHQLLKAVDGAKLLKLVLVDACRDNPFGSQVSATRSIGRGLSRIEPQGGVLVSYAAKGGTVAYDGDDSNSPYASALIENLDEPGLEIGKLFRKVRDSVLSSTKGRQEPFTYGSLPSSDIFLKERKNNSILADFEIASIEPTIEKWTHFIDQHRINGQNNSLVNAAESMRDLLVKERDTKEIATAVPVDKNLNSSEKSLRLTLPEIQSPEEIELGLALTKTQYRQVQELLTSIGYQPGPTDGQFGKKSRSALKNFQKDAGLEAHGFIQQSTVDEIIKLFNASPETLNGTWRINYYRTMSEAEFRRLKANGEGRASDKLVKHHFGFIEFEIQGQKVKPLKSISMANSKHAKDAEFRADLNRSRLLSMSFVANYEYFKSASRRVNLAARLPERVQINQEFVLDRRRLSSAYDIEGILQRVSAN